MSAATRTALVALAAALGWACPALGTGEEELAGDTAESEDRIPVVDDEGPFDPSEAVDDDDGAVVLEETDDPTDESAFSDGDARAVEASAKRAENEKEEGEPGEDGEPVANEEEVSVREAERRAEVERADASGADDDAEKVELGHNPPPEPTVESESEGGKALDLFLELSLVAIAAALLSAALVFARSHPRGVLVGTLVLVVAVAFFASQVA